MLTSGPAQSEKAQAFLSAMMIILVLTVVSTLVDQILPFYPLDTGGVPAQWRFERIGTLLGSAPMLLVQLVLLVLVASQVGSRIVVRWVAAFLMIVGVLTVPAVLIFLLDFVEVRSVVQVNNRERFDLVAMKTGLFGGILAIPAIWLGWRGWQATVFEANAPRGKGDGLVIGR